MKQERNSLHGQETKRQGQQNEQLQETDLNQTPNVQEVGLDRDTQEERMGQQNDRELNERQQGTERSGRGL